MIKQILLCFVVAIAMTLAGWFILPATVEESTMLMTLVLTFIFSFVMPMYIWSFIDSIKYEGDITTPLFAISITTVFLATPYLIVFSY